MLLFRFLNEFLHWLSVSPAGAGSVFASLSYPCSCCLCPREVLLVYSVQSLCVSQAKGATEFSLGLLSWFTLCSCSLLVCSVQLQPWVRVPLRSQGMDGFGGRVGLVAFIGSDS